MVRNHDRLGLGVWPWCVRAQLDRWEMATMPLYFLIRTLLLVLISCSALSSCSNVSGTDDNDSDIVTSISVFESSEYDSVTNVPPSAEPTAESIVASGEKNTTENAAIVIGIRNALSSLGMEMSGGDNGTAVTGRVKMSQLFHPLMLVPGLIVWGFAPVIVAKLKWLVWQALMLNHMALMSAWYMTLRNIVFGPRPGGIVKYANHGYGPNRFYHYHRH